MNAPGSAADPIFVKEQEHLSETYAKLKRIEDAQVAKLANIMRAAAADKSSMSDDLGLDTADLDHSFEAQVELEGMNQVIDEYNAAARVASENLSRARQLLAQPYFAKVELRFKPTDPVKDIYIGSTGMTDENRRHFVIDWRSPVAETYYNRDMGRTSYEANGRTIVVDLENRRQFDIEADRLNAYFDTSVAIEDPLLLASLKKHRSARMQAITATIQKEQNEVIRHEDVPVLLVDGIAGSGKTSVLMQRIAYLFYRERETLDPSDVHLFTPNPVFRRYIDDVLPQMGESNPHSTTWARFARSLGATDRGMRADELSADDLERIDEMLDGFRFEVGDFRPVVLRTGRAVLTAAQIQGVFDKFGRIPAGPRLFAAVEEELFDRLTNRVKQAAHTEWAEDEMLGLDEGEQRRLFNEYGDPLSDEETASRIRIYLDDLHADAFKTLETFGWLNVDRVARRLIGRDNLTTAEWLYLKTAITGMGDPWARYVMVDEVQDYTSAQLAVLARYFRSAHFMLLGDENQAVVAHTATYGEIRRLFARAFGSVDECRLMTSYRSSPEITALFAGLLDADARIEVNSVQPEGMAPAFVAAASDEAYAQALCEAVRDARSGEGLVALVARSKQELKRIERILGEDAPRVMRGDEPLPESGMVALEVSLAKGLEFDHVVIPDASSSAYPPDDDIARRRLYVALSRATRRLTVLAKGPATPLLSGLA